MIAEPPETLFYDFQYLCRRGARKFLRDGLERSDLEQVAAIGLLKACRRYDGRDGTPFEAYAWLMVVGELMHFVRDYERPMRIPRWLRQLEKRRLQAHDRLTAQLQREPTDGELAGAMGVNVSLIDELKRASTVCIPAPLQDDRTGRISTSQIVSTSSEVSIDDRLSLEQGLTRLPSVQKTILVGIYGFGLTQAEVAQQVNLSPRHVSRLHRKALDSMQAFWSGPRRLGHCSDHLTSGKRHIGVEKVKTIRGRFRDENGFTLLELMIVVAIIAIIAAILVPNFFHARAQAAVSACEANIRSVATALELYYTDHQGYPGTGAVNNALFSGTGGGQNPYLTQQPHDPGAVDPTATYTFTAPAGANLAYQIDCPGTHPANALASVPGGATADANIHYDSSAGFSAIHH